MAQEDPAAGAAAGISASAQENLGITEVLGTSGSGG
jgi:hypothetical protein